MIGLTADDLCRLVKGVFPRLPDDRFLGVLVDIPSHAQNDNTRWKERRLLAEEWFALLQKRFIDLKLHGVRLIVYPDIGSNNADLPSRAFTLSEGIPDSANDLSTGSTALPFSDIFLRTQLFLAMTEYSATAPLKMAARTYGFRAATMPGFSRDMIPALRIDYNTVSRRVIQIKERLDRAQAARVVFFVEGGRTCDMTFDLRNRPGHASTGRFPEAGTAGNLPSGEAYIVPYEGEEEKSQTEGILPVETDEGLVYFTVKENRAVFVEGENPAAGKEKDHLRREPAYGNMAELGFGVLADFGLEASGSILLDEKLGFHIAFGRSEHFGGITGPDSFSSPSAVIHLDRIYIHSMQPRIQILSIDLDYGAGETERLMEKGRYLVF